MTMHKQDKAESAGQATVIHPVVDNIYVANGIVRAGVLADAHSFRLPKIKYHGYCDDFGPMNASSVIEFVKAMENKMISQKKKQIIYISEDGARGFTNGVFLMGCYLILKFKMSAASVWEIFADIPSNELEGFRDATFSDAEFRLSLFDCWQGFSRAQSFGWIDMPESPSSRCWGAIYKEEYDQYEHPLNGNLTIVVPGKFVAFQGPVDLADGQVYLDSSSKGRRFSPKYYLDIFEVLGVDSVARLNEPHYDPRTFEQAGVKVHELEFEDCTPPPPDVISRFLAAADASRGLVAVHCKAGLGRTGTLIALYLIRSYGFSAREAMGWLRIMRPGSVIGQQQIYLCEVERLLAGAAHKKARTPSPTRPRPAAETAAAAAEGGGTPHQPVKMASASRVWSSMPDMRQGLSFLARKLPTLPGRRAAAAAAAASSDKGAVDSNPAAPPSPTAAAAAAAAAVPRRRVSLIALHARSSSFNLGGGDSPLSSPAAAAAAGGSTDATAAATVPFPPRLSLRPPVPPSRRNSAIDAQDVTAALARRASTAAATTRRRSIQE